VVATGDFAGTEVLRVGKLADSRLGVGVNENDVVKCKVGDPVRIRIDGIMRNTNFMGGKTDPRARHRAEPIRSKSLTNLTCGFKFCITDRKIRRAMSASVEQ